MEIFPRYIADTLPLAEWTNPLNCAGCMRIVVIVFLGSLDVYHSFP